MIKPDTLTRRRFGAGVLALTALSACADGNSAPRQQPRNRRRAENRVALLLPLTGKRQALGQQMAKTVWLAEDLTGNRGRTAVIDAGETPAAAAAAAQQSLAQGANVIVGPLFQAQTPAVLQAAGNVPVITLSNDAALAQQGAWVFGVTPAQSVDAVLRYAQSSGASRVSILEAEGTLGARAAAALSIGARKARVSPLPQVAKETTPSDMSAALKTVGGGQMPDILYVPTTNERTLEQAIAAVQAGVTTIGSLQWAGLPPATLERLDKACFTGPDPDRFGRLSANYQAQLEEEMGVIAALAVDAVAVAQDLGGKRQLARRKPFDGLLGPTRFRSDRTCARELSVLRITGRHVQRVL